MASTLIAVLIWFIASVASEESQPPLHPGLAANDSSIRGVVIKTVTLILNDENGHPILPAGEAEKFKQATEQPEANGESHIDRLVRAAKALESNDYEVVVLKSQNGKKTDPDLLKQHLEYALQGKRSAPTDAEVGVPEQEQDPGKSQDEFISTPPMAHGEDWIFEKPSDDSSNGTPSADDIQQNRSMRATVLSPNGATGGAEKLFSSTKYCGFSPKVDPSRLSNIAPGQFPWAAAILSPQNKFLCAGTLISSSIVVTTASCVIRYRNTVQNNQPLKVVLGVWSLPEGHEFFPELEVFVSAAAIHPNFNTNDIGSPASIANNVALLRLTMDVDFDIYPHIFPICVIGPNLAAQASTARCQVMGWPDLPETESWRTRAYLGAGEVHITPQGCPGISQQSLCIQGQVCFGNEGSAVQCLADSNRYYLLGMLGNEPNCNKGSSITFSSVNIISHYNLLSGFLFTQNPNQVPVNQQTNSIRQ